MAATRAESDRGHIASNQCGADAGDAPAAIDPQLAMAVLDNVNEAAIVLDGELRLRWANRAAERFFRHKLQDVAGRCVLDLYPASRGGPIEAFYRGVLSSAEVRVATVPYAPTGRWLAVRGVPHDGGLIAYYQDVTAEHEARQSLESSEARYRAMAERVSDVLSVSDPDGICRWISPSVRRVLGWTPEELIGSDLRSLIHPDDLIEIDRQRAAVTAGQQEAVRRATLQVGEDVRAGFDMLGAHSARLRYRARTKDGGERWIEATGQFVFDDAGTLVESIFVSRDINEIVETQEQLRSARDAAQALAAARSAFLANMSHEIRTPLHGIIGMAGLLEETRLDDTQRRYLEIIQGSGDALLSVINDILDLSKIEAGRMELFPEPTDVRAEVEAVLDLLAPSASEKGLELVGFVDPKVPEAVLLDGGRLRQVLVNLIGNAVKFTPEGEVVVRVECDTRTEPPRLQVRVRDTGIGIDPKAQFELFEPFVQADSGTTRRHGGSGLGLSISRHLVRMMGGDIRLESVLGGGSTFSFELPTSRAPKPATPRPALPHAIRGNVAAILDDNETHREVLRRQLEAMALRCEVFANAESMRHWLRQGKRCDIVLLDVRMPDVHGEALAEEIAVMRPGLPLVLLSSLGAPVRTPVAAAVLHKPVRRLELQATVRKALGVRGGAQPAPRRSSGTNEDTARLVDGLEILLAEDNDVNAMVVGLQLERWKVRVTRVNDGAAAVEHVSAKPVDLVLMDVQMPQLDGLAATRAIRQLPLASQPYIVALTAGAMDDDRARALDAGMDAHLPKPLPADGLQRVLMAAARRRALVKR